MNTTMNENLSVGEKTGKVFFVFIALLRTLATCLITNTHYGAIYPISQLAVGGLIGDVLFFSVSGFCLMRPTKENFLKWYGHRLSRIYPSVILVGLIMWAIDRNEIHSFGDFVSGLIYPTYYHFIASIVLLYILFYPIAKYPVLQKKIPYIMLGVAALWILYYIFFFDKSSRLDVAALPITRFLFFECMLLGAYIKTNLERFINKNNWKKWVCVVCSLVLYFLSKLIIDKYQLMKLQFVIILLIFWVGASLVIAFCGINERLSRLTIVVKTAEFLAGLTLEIYIIQGALIDTFETIIFPLNFLITTLSIVGVAWIINKTVCFIRRVVVGNRI